MKSILCKYTLSHFIIPSTINAKKKQTNIERNQKNLAHLEILKSLNIIDAHRPIEKDIICHNNIDVSEKTCDQLNNQIALYFESMAICHKIHIIAAAGTTSFNSKSK